MKLYVTDHKALSAAASLMASAAPTKPSVPILSQVRLSTEGNQIVLTATDLDTTIQIYVPAEVQAPGSTTVSARDLARMLKSFKQAVRLAADAGSLEVLSGGMIQKLPTIPADEYPKIPEPAGLPVVVPAVDLRAGLGHALHAAGADSNSVMYGVQIRVQDGKLEIAATDGHRLVVYEAPWDGDPLELIVPLPAAVRLQKLLGPDVLYSPEGVWDLAGGVRLISRPIEGQYPNYRQIMRDSHKYEAVLPVKTLQTIVAACKAVASETEGLRFTFKDDGTVTISSSSWKGEVSQTLDCASDFNLVIVFNCRYVLAVLAHVRGPSVKIQLQDKLSAAYWTDPDEPTWLELLMPIQP